jgi:hypothetical protein
VWGDWHISQFIKHGLPSLKAPGNLDAIDYVIAVHTTPRDIGKLMPALRGVKTEFYTSIPDKLPAHLSSAVDVQQAIHRGERGLAERTGAMWACLPPDVVWGEHSWALYRKFFEAGKWAIFQHMPRATDDAGAAFYDYSKRHLARVALDFEHPLGRMYRADNPTFPKHAELIIWPAPHGLLTRLLASEIKVCDPSKVAVNRMAQSARTLGDRAAVIQDSDEAIAISLASVHKDEDWTRDGVPLSAQVVRSFLGDYPSPATRDLARYSYRLHADEADPASWLAAERRADNLMASIFDGFRPAQVA